VLTDEFDLPPDRPMPDLLKESMWNRLVPELHGRRRRKTSKPWAAGISVGALALSAALVFTSAPDPAPQMTLVPAGAAPRAEDWQRLKECFDVVRKEQLPKVPLSGWRPALRIEISPGWDFLVVRTEKVAGACLVNDGISTGLVTLDLDEVNGTRGGYASLSEDVPLRQFTGIAGPGSPTSLFGIVADQVTSVSVLMRDHSLVPALLHDGTFAVRLNGDVPAHGNKFQVTMTDGRVLVVNGQ